MSEVDYWSSELMEGDMLLGILGNLSYPYGNDSYDYNETGDGDICDLSEGMKFEAVFIPILYYVALIVGVLGNGVLLGVLFHSRKIWSVTDTFILHLGVADILLLVTLPFWATQYAQDKGWTFGTPFCKIVGSVFVINFYCGIFLLACISLDRYLSIVHATQMYSRRKPWVVQATCLSVWLFSLLLSIPDWFFYEALPDRRRGRIECIHNYLISGKETVVVWQWASRLLYHIVGFLLPSAILIFCYSCILDRLRRGTRGLQKQKAFRVILTVVVAFFLCWTPYNITLMVDTLHSGNSTDTCGKRSSLDKAITVTFTLGCLHCCLNPILYAFVGVKFRRQLMDILRSLFCKLKTNVKFQSTVRRSSMWSESADTSHSTAI